MGAEKELNTLQDRLAEHIVEFHNHREDFERHVEEVNDRWEHLIQLTESNTRAIHDLAEATRGLVEAWRTGSNIGRFLKWLSSFAILAAIAAWFVENFKG